MIGPFAFLITNQLSVGRHKLAAVFTPGDPTAFESSTSNTVKIKVTGRGNHDNGNNGTG
jgi:hypothetical protein